MKNSRKIILGGVILALATWVFVSQTGDTAQEKKPSISKSGGKKQKVKRLISIGNEPSIARMKIDAARVAMTNRNGKVVHRVRVASQGDVEDDWVDEDGKPWPKEQLELMRAIHLAGEEEDFPSLVTELDAVLKCPNPEIREKYVDELGWHGEPAILELTSFLSDPSEDVVDAARTHLVDAVQELEDDAEKAAVVTTLSKAVSDKDLVETLADELMAMDELLALQTICDIIDTGTPKAIEAVKEMYETITDEKWTGIDDAEAWLQANYDGAEELMGGNRQPDEDKQPGDVSPEEASP